MTHKNLSPSNPTLSEVKEKFELWRKTRKNRKRITAQVEHFCNSCLYHFLIFIGLVQTIG